MLSVISNSTACVRTIDFHLLLRYLWLLHQQQVKMVAFSRITFALAVASLSSAQSFSVPIPSGIPTDLPSGAARPTGGFGGEGHGHSGDHSGFAHPTGGLHSHGPRPSGTGVFGAQSAQQSGEAPSPSGGSFSGFPSGAARPTGHHGHHDGKGKHSGLPSGAIPTGFPSAASVLERRRESTDLPVFSGSFPAPSGFPSGGFPSGGFPAPSGSFPGGFPESGAPFPTNVDFTSFPSGVAHPSGHHGHHGKGGKHSGHVSGGPAPTASQSATSSILERRQQPSGAFSGPALSGPVPSGPRPTGPIHSGVAPPNGARPSGHPHGPRPSGKPTGARPSGGPPSGAPSAAPSGLGRRAQRSGSVKPSGTPPAKPTGVRPSGAPTGLRPTGARPSGKPSGPAPSGVHTTGPPPSGKPSGHAPTGFVTSTVRGA